VAERGVRTWHGEEGIPAIAVDLLPNGASRERVMKPAMVVAGVDGAVVLWIARLVPCSRCSKSLVVARVVRGVFPLVAVGVDSMVVGLRKEFVE